MLSFEVALFLRSRLTLIGTKLGHLGREVLTHEFQSGEILLGNSATCVKGQNAQQSAHNVGVAARIDYWYDCVRAAACLVRFIALVIDSFGSR